LPFEDNSLAIFLIIFSPKMKSYMVPRFNREYLWKCPGAPAVEEV